MSSSQRAVLWTVLCAFLAAGQTAERVFPFKRTEAPQHLQEIATAIRAVAVVQELRADLERRTLTVRGSEDQLALSEWLFHQLDVTPPATPGDAVREFRTAPAADGVTRVFFLAPDRTPQRLQEVATLVRSIGEIRRLFTYSRLNAVILRGTPAQIALGDWMIRDLERPPDSARHYSMLYPYQEPGAAPDYVRIYYPHQNDTVQSVQETATLVRSLGELRRLFTLSGPPAIAVRGTSGQLALAAWMFDELNAPATPRQDSDVYPYREGGTMEDTVRVFYLKNTATVAGFQESAVSIRKATGIRRLFTHNGTRALAVRGTAAQVTHAEQLLKQRRR